MVQDTDYAWHGLGPPISLTRTYNLDGPNGMFGNGWSFAYESSLGNDTLKCINGDLLRTGSGRELFFTAEFCNGLPIAPPVHYSSPNGVYDRLTYLGGGIWAYEEKSSGLTYRYGHVDGGFRAKLVSVADPDGNAVSLGYDASGRLVSLTDAAGRVTTFGYDASHHCTSMTLADGRAASYSYDGLGNLVSTTDLAGNATLYTYDEHNALSSMTVGGRVSTFTHSWSVSGSRVATVTDAEGRIQTYGITLGIVRATDAAGGVSYFASNQGRTTMTMDPSGGQTSTPMTNGLPTQHTDARGNFNQLSWDGRGNLTGRTDPLGGESSLIWDATDNPTSATNPLSKITTYAWDGERHLLSETSPEGRIASYTYDAQGRRITATDPDGRVTTFGYDAWGNLASLTDPLGKTWTYEYAPPGFRMARRTDPLGHATNYQYDANDRVTRVTFADGAARIYTYDCCSLTGVTDERGNTVTTETDRTLNPVRVTDPLGNAVTTTWDRISRPVKVTDARGKSVTTAYDAADHPVRTTDPVPSAVARAFDANGNLASLTDPRGNTTLFEHDSLDRLSRTTDPAGRAVTVSRDAAGRIASITNSRDQVVAFTHDGDGRLTGKAYAGQPAASYSYNGAGDLVSMTDGTGTTTFTLDTARRVIGMGWSDGTSLALGYNAAGKPTSLGYPGGFTVTCGYDARDRVTTVSWGGQTISLAYDAAGNLTGITRPNGTATALSYDARNLVTGISHTKGTTEVLASVAYTRDANGRVIREDRQATVKPAVTAGSWSAVYNKLNQPTSRATDTFAHDKDGNLTKINAGESFLASYDAENRLTSVTRTGETVTAAYDGLGRRTRTVVDGVEFRHHHDRAGRLLFTTNAGGTVTARYIWAGKRLVAMVTAEGTFYYYHFDALGSTLLLTDAAGQKVATYAYLPYGAPAGSSGSIDNPFTFVGERGVMDEGDGLYLMGRRHYDASLGRFLQRDPLGFKAGPNLYAYVDRDPVNLVDPGGLKEYKPWLELIPGYGYYQAVEEYNKGNYLCAAWEAVKEYAGPFGDVADLIENSISFAAGDSEGTRKRRGEDTVRDIKWDSEKGRYTGLTPEALGKEPERDPEEQIHLLQEEPQEHDSYWPE